MPRLFGMKTVAGKAIVLVVVMVVVSIAATTAFLLWHFSTVLGVDRLRQNVTAAEMIINPNHEPWSVANGKLMAGDHMINGDEHGVDAIASAFGGVATVFLGDTRIATTIRSDTGNRAVGTKLTAGPVYEAVLGKGAEYLGSATILGKDYVTAYKPIKSSAGETLGILFVGVERQVFNKEMSFAVMLAGIAALLLSAVCGGAGGYFFLKLCAPLRPLSELMTDARQGRFAQKVPFADREDEFGELARATEVFHRCARERERQSADIVRVVESFSVALEKLAKHDLTYRITSQLPAEYRLLQDNFNNALSQLDRAMQEIDTQARDIEANSGEIHRASAEMAQRTEQEAAALEQTAASVNELTSTLETSAESARQANDRAAEAKNNAEQGSKVVAKAVEAIRAIASSSSEITQIIGVINDIAFQTNLLALNAGVEAARAGEAGKGFAVVASEVRSLAQRSGEAAKQIKQIITLSEEQVDKGVTLVEESGKVFGRIVGEIGSIYGLVSAISQSQREQATAVREIDSTLEQLDHATQQNAAMAEQSSAASETMAHNAHELTGRVGEFHIARHENLRPVRVRAA